MNRVSVFLPRLSIRGMAGKASGASAAPVTTTGIEHADSFKKTGMQKPVDPKLYKCDEYLHFNTYSYYDSEIDMAKMRVPQPTNKKPDVLPKCN